MLDSVQAYVNGCVFVDCYALQPVAKFNKPGEGIAPSFPFGKGVLLIIRSEQIDFGNDEFTTQRAAIFGFVILNEGLPKTKWL